MLMPDIVADTRSGRASGKHRMPDDTCGLW